jgi:hypothetical protein
MKKLLNVKIVGNDSSFFFNCLANIKDKRKMGNMKGVESKFMQMVTSKMDLMGYLL